ncbi:Hypothetical_protein [Hexamita inflata]|uniref:Hypothetical_protein n=1 Tax=Hexamita inflata TaxID=28002 RepID=A0AA86PP13_9EUKA|nr:Hypothetical protein HINF_LOCUS25989 [Hexamita inflata]CAI9946988.1 Hypothetical protein HINF_LOCUS34633 [Hexamita inflata]
MRRRYGFQRAKLEQRIELCIQYGTSIITSTKIYVSHFVHSYLNQPCSCINTGKTLRKVTAVRHGRSSSCRFAKLTQRAMSQRKCLEFAFWYNDPFRGSKMQLILKREQKAADCSVSHNCASPIVVFNQTYFRIQELVSN